VIGFIGLGVMGEPMCRNLARKSGRSVLAWDLRAEPLERLVADGVAAARSIEEVAKKAEIVFLSLPGEPQIREVTKGLQDNTVVDCSTAPVSLAKELSTQLANFADAPVARTRQAAIDGTLSVMVGGTEAEFQRMRPLLAHIGTDIAHCGACGAGQAMKLINNMVLFQNVVALAEALAVVKRTGLDPALALEVMSKGSADSFALRHHGLKAMLPARFPERAFSVEYARKDLGYILQLAKHLQLDLSGARNTRTVLDKASAAGLGKEYFPALMKVI